MNFGIKLRKGKKVMYKYRKKCEINYQDVDYMGVLKLSHLLDIFSNIATTHAIELGVWSEELIEQYGWILAKMHIEIKKPIKSDIYELMTYPGKASKVIYPRYYKLLRGNEELVKASSIWTLLDLKRRRITMPSRANIEFPKIESVDEEIALPEDILSDKINYVYKESRIVHYSDVDTNQHMNNARYLEWACDLIDYEYFRDHFIEIIDIFFKHEISPKSKVDLYYYHQENDFYIKGMVNEIICFEIKLKGKNKKS